MKNILYISLVLIVIISFVSCEKTVLNREAKGHVLDSHTGQPIAGAWVKLYRTKVLSAYRDYDKPIDSCITGTDGLFDFEYRKTRSKQIGDDFYHTYRVLAGAQGYLYDPDIDWIAADGSEESNTKKLEIRLVPKAVLVFDVRSSKGGKSILLGTDYSRYAITDIVLKGTFKQYPHDVEGDRNIHIRYIITDSSGNGSQHDTTIFCPVHQTSNFLIEF